MWSSGGNFGGVGGAIAPPIQNKSEISLKSRDFLVLEVKLGVQLENFDTCALTIYFEKAELISLTLDSF